MKFKIVPSKQSEASELLTIQKEVFHTDLLKYKDYHISPAAESLEAFYFRMLTSSHYSIFVEDRFAGGICLINLAKDHCYLFRIFLGCEYQNKGLGTKIFRYLERQFPQVKKWTLDTPKDNKRNRHFYEKFGYQKKREQKINEFLTLINYEKIL